MNCQFCNSDRTLLYAVSIGGQVIDASRVHLCSEHGGRLLLRYGMVLATLDKPLDNVFSSEHHRGDK